MDRFTTPYYLCHHPVNLLQVSEVRESVIFTEKGSGQILLLRENDGNQQKEREENGITEMPGSPAISK
ncbi:MAG: hypothetical protein AB9903_29865 [Vulcanimicrobiota bacterium]